MRISVRINSASAQAQLRRWGGEFRDKVKKAVARGIASEATELKEDVRTHVAGQMAVVKKSFVKGFTAKVLDKANEDAVMFIVEIEHAAVFLLRNIPEEHMSRVLAVDCPLMLFPFTRQIVSQLSLDGGFMPFLMEPINFVGLYDNLQKQKQDA